MSIWETNFCTKEKGEAVNIQPSANTEQKNIPVIKVYIFYPQTRTFGLAQPTPIQ